MEITLKELIAQTKITLLAKSSNSSTLGQTELSTASVLSILTQQMTELLLQPARQTGCSDLTALQEAVDEASHRQSSPLVMLPHESHGYRARASVLHMVWEMDRWLDMYVKNAAPLEAASSSEQPADTGE